jgi:tRNA threonylcarbamoyladenosine biosynthesis protein TsaB
MNGRRILALETATSHGSVALLVGDRVVERAYETRGAGALAAAENLLADEGIVPHTLDAVAVSVGPGSFTGVRLGVSAAQGIAIGIGCRLVAVGTLEALAEAARDTDWGVPGAFVLPLVDARRNEVYASLYRIAESGEEPRLLWGPDTVSRSKLVERLARLVPERARVDVGVLCGDGAAGLAPFFAEGAGWDAPARLGRAQAAAVARVGARRLEQGTWVGAEELQPVYLRKSDAEIAREKREAEQRQAGERDAGERSADERGAAG